LDQSATLPNTHRANNSTAFIIHPNLSVIDTKIHQMSLFPIIPQSPHPQHTMLASSVPKSDERAQHHTTNAVVHFHVPHCHAVRQHLASALASLFAPTSYQQYTSSSTSPYRIQDYNTRITVDDEFVLLEEILEKDEQDGGPLCREATIESWKVMTTNRKRRLSMHCFE
jgi:hypothetical protein